MSDFLLVRCIDRIQAKPVLDAWKATQQWVRSVELSDVWEPQHLKINGRDAIVYMTGKHKAELAKLVLLIQQSGGRLVHLMLHRREAERIEEDMGEWALKKECQAVGRELPAAMSWRRSQTNKADRKEEERKETSAGEEAMDNLLPGTAVSVRCPACQRAVLIPMELANRPAGTEISCKCLGCDGPIRVTTPLSGSGGDRSERVRATIYVWCLAAGLAGLVWLLTFGPFLALPINHPVILILFGLCLAVGVGLTISIWRSTAKK